MTSASPKDEKANPPATKAKASYKAGIALTIVGFLYGIVIVALHYGTTGNMFAGHSLYRYSTNNPLPLVFASAGIIFIVGLILMYVGRPTSKSPETTTT